MNNMYVIHQEIYLFIKRIQGWTLAMSGKVPWAQILGKHSFIVQ